MDKVSTVKYSIWWQAYGWGHNGLQIQISSKHGTDLASTDIIETERSWNKFGIVKKKN